MLQVFHQVCGGEGNTPLFPINLCNELQRIQDWLVHFQLRFFRHVYATYQFELLANEFIDGDVDLGDHLDGCFVSVQKLLGHVNGNSIYTYIDPRIVYIKCRCELQIFLHVYKKAISLFYETEEKKMLLAEFLYECDMADFFLCKTVKLKYFLNRF